MATYIGNSKLYRRTKPSIVLTDYATKVKERMLTNELTGYDIIFYQLPEDDYTLIGVYPVMITQGAQDKDIYSLLVTFKVEDDTNEPLSVYDKIYKICECFDIPNSFVYEDSTLGVRSYIRIEKDESISILYDERKFFSIYAIYDFYAAKMKIQTA